MPGLLTHMLHMLDIPTDARLTSVSASLDPVDGATIWTVQYKSSPPGGAQAVQQQQLHAMPAMPYSHPHPAMPYSHPDSPRQYATHVPSAPRDLPAGPPRIEIPASQTYPSMREIPSPMQSASGGGNFSRCFPLKCIVQTYAWGKVGLDSAVARIAFADASLNDDIELEEQTPYAELWMGTHPSGPSLVVLETPWKTITPLSEWLKHNPALAGSKVQLKNKGSVPFLLKILSVRTALSIQAHPDKRLAQELHAKRADLYKDDNHKPEMAIAITPFEALCSFQRATSIVANCTACPELVEIIGEDSVSALDQAATSEDDVKPALRALYTRLMTAPTHVVEGKLSNLIKRIDATVEMLRAPVDTLALRIHEQYPGDVGVFCVYLMNYICLKPGEALFMAANEPHAYLYGDCVECMATSDNVVRAGLTPKFKDTNTLCSMLTYSDGPVERIQGTPVGKFVQAFVPPADVDEFRMERCQLPPKSASPLKAVDGVCILIIVSGKGTIEESGLQAGSTASVQNVAMGSILLVSAGTHLQLKTFEEGMLAFRAMPRNA